jgi:hypothetical protein
MTTGRSCRFVVNASGRGRAVEARHSVLEAPLLDNATVNQSCDPRFVARDVRLGRSEVRGSLEAA